MKISIFKIFGKYCFQFSISWKKIAFKVKNVTFCAIYYYETLHTIGKKFHCTEEVDATSSLFLRGMHHELFNQTVCDFRWWKRCPYIPIQFWRNLRNFPRSLLILMRKMMKLTTKVWIYFCQIVTWMTFLTLTGQLPNQVSFKIKTNFLNNYLWKIPTFKKFDNFQFFWWSHKLLHSLQFFAQKFKLDQNFKFSEVINKFQRRN